MFFQNREYSTFRGIISILLSVVFGAAAQEHETDLLNKLYNEIVSSIPKNAGSDSMIPGLTREVQQENSQLPEKAAPDNSSERLSREIESMVQEANDRHDDAVRFMLDTK